MIVSIIIKLLEMKARKTKWYNRLQLELNNSTEIYSPSKVKKQKKQTAATHKKKVIVKKLNKNE